MWRKRRTRERRGSDRRPVEWIGRYGAPETFGVGWSPCAIENISVHGASALVDGDRAVAVGQRITIDLERVGDTSVGMRVTGRVRHIDAERADSKSAFGVQLEFSSPQERRTAEMLFSA